MSCLADIRSFMSLCKSFRKWVRGLLLCIPFWRRRLACWAAAVVSPRLLDGFLHTWYATMYVTLIPCHPW